MKRFLFLAVAAALLCPVAALAQSTVLDQNPAPINTSGNSQVLTQSINVTGGKLYVTTARPAGQPQGPLSIAQSFVSSSAAALTRYFSLTNGKTDVGVSLTASPGAGVFGVSRTAGTSLVLTGETTSGNAKTDKVMFEFNLPDSYVAGNAIPVVVNANYSGGGTITGVSTTIAVAAYTEVNGVETAIGSITAAQQITGTAANYTFSVPGTGLVPGQHLVVEFTLLVTSASGGNTGQINSAAFNG